MQKKLFGGRHKVISRSNFVSQSLVLCRGVDRDRTLFFVAASTGPNLEKDSKARASWPLERSPPSDLEWDFIVSR